MRITWAHLHGERSRCSGHRVAAGSNPAAAVQGLSVDKAYIVCVRTLSVSTPDQMTANRLTIIPRCAHSRRRQVFEHAACRSSLTGRRTTISATVWQCLTAPRQAVAIQAEFKSKKISAYRFQELRCVVVSEPCRRHPTLRQAGATCRSTLRCKERRSCAGQT